ncbi:MAG: glycosyl transferase family 1 [Geobacteraceae bacterium GWC2_58_44]|nr:MAG: glycosyl transferase family 1 [Geobacteraceae bacterium GWC2_58_44]HBG07022.1 glycosyl transferase family 1 [Geobacter sp.]
MKILFQSRKTLFSVPGGDTVQLLKTAEALRETGCRVDVSTDLEPDLAGYDLVHLFNLMRPQEVYLQALNAKRQGRRVALSTIYGPYIEYERKARGGLAGVAARLLPHSQLEYLKVLARAVKNLELNRGTLSVLARGYKTLQAEIVEMTDVFLPNSGSEMARVHADFPASAAKPCVVVPNAVDTVLFDPETVTVSPELQKYQGCVLSVARIEGRKCQLELVRAMRDLPWKLVLIGKPAPNHTAYYEQIKQEAGPNVEFIGQVEHDRLAEYYKAAKVHCLISWMETPGLSSLEAGAMGCNLVVTEKGDARDYFGEHAVYCEPDSVESIRSAIVHAYQLQGSARLAETIRSAYRWRDAAVATAEGYRSIQKG